MIKMTMVTDSRNTLVGAVHGHTLAEKKGSVEARVSFPPDHKLHKIEVEDDLAEINDPAEFHKRLLKHVPQS